MPKFVRGVIFMALLINGISSLAQDHIEESGNQQTTNDPGIEVVISGFLIHTPEHNHTDPATELHITYWVSHTWAFGLGYTVIFEEENSLGHELAALVSHKPWHFLTVNAGPSFSIPNSHSDLKVSGYLEGELNFKIGLFHTGPMAGVLVGEEFSFFGGFHFGLEF